MATSFPTGLDAIQRVAATDLRNAPGKEGHVLHNNVCDAVEALQAKVGVDGSAVATSIDKRLAAVESELVTVADTADTALDYCNETIAGSTIAGAIATAMNTDALFRILLIGDSTADATTEWAYLLLQQLQSRYPNAQVQHSLWDNVNKRWPATTILQQGSGSGGVIILNNCSIAGSQPDWIIGSDFFKICKVGAELLILNHGHNISNSEYPDAQKIITQYEENVESALAIVGPCHVMIIAQNPQMGLSNQTKATAARKYATECRFVSADVDLAFVAAGNGESLHSPDHVHPSVPDGHTLIKNVVLDAIDNKPSYIVTPSLVNTYAANMLYNGNFAAGSANAVPTGWSGNNIGVTDSITLGVNCETLPRALSLLAASGSGQAWIRQELAIEDFQACVGRIVTLAVRMWRPVGAPNTCGKIQLYASGTGTPSHVSASSDYGRGAWSWRFVSVTVPANATVLRAFIYADTSATPTTNAAYAILVDRAILVIGRRPRDAS